MGFQGPPSEWDSWYQIYLCSNQLVLPGTLRRKAKWQENEGEHLLDGFRRLAAERFDSCENIVALAKEPEARWRPGPLATVVASRLYSS